MAKDYVFDNAWSDERRRIASIEDVFDPGTLRILGGLVSPGMQVLEAGGGGGSVARWLCDAVSPGGSVLATDLDTRFLDEISHDALEVRRHDIVSEELSAETFDLVHARCLLEHLPARDEVLKRMVSSLKPGGWLVLEDVDWVVDTAVPATKMPVYPASGKRLYAKTWKAMGKLGEIVGIDKEYARRLPYVLMDAGLVDVDAESRNRLVRGGSVAADFNLLTLQQVRGMLTASGWLTERDVENALANTADPESFYMSATIVAAWGRKPL